MNKALNPYVICFEVCRGIAVVFEDDDSLSSNLRIAFRLRIQLEGFWINWKVMLDWQVWTWKWRSYFSQQSKNCCLTQKFAMVICNPSAKSWFHTTMIAWLAQKLPKKSWENHGKPCDDLSIHPTVFFCFFLLLGNDRWENMETQYRPK